MDMKRLSDEERAELETEAAKANWDPFHGGSPDTHQRQVQAGELLVGTLQKAEEVRLSTEEDRNRSMNQLIRGGARANRRPLPASFLATEPTDNPEDQS